MKGCQLMCHEQGRTKMDGHLVICFNIRGDGSNESISADSFFSN
jgi:hypothetical protein